MRSPLKSPFYFVIALLACGYLAAANQRGWSILQPFAARPVRAHNAPIRHK
jgi:hypothetical protein